MRERGKQGREGRGGHAELVADVDAVARVEGVDGPADADFGDETHQHQRSDLRTRNVLLLLLLFLLLLYVLTSVSSHTSLLGAVVTLLIHD